MDVFSIAATACLLLCGILAYVTRPKSDVLLPDGFRRFQGVYLVAWTLCVAGEWMKGPGVYALYASWGLSKEEIASIFVYGYIAALLVGPFIGAMADSFGRKRSVFLYCAINVASCAAKHSDNWYLMRGARCLDGMVSSLLFIVFESWLVHEHLERNRYPSELLGVNFSMMYFVSYLTAIGCGFLAQAAEQSVEPGMLADLHVGGWTVPFDIAAVFLVMGAAFVMQNWGENYGRQSNLRAIDGLTTMGQGLKILLTDTRAMLCCFVSACFEGSMFVFIVLWTPTLSAGGIRPPCGIAFATYMMACMSGAAVFQLFSPAVPANVILFFTCILGAAAMAVPAFGGVTADMVTPNFIAFVIFEFSVGIYFPASGKMKSEFIPESHRATIYGAFRAPISAVVLTVLLKGAPLLFSLRFVSMLLGSSAMLLAAFWVQIAIEERHVSMRKGDILSNALLPDKNENYITVV